MNKVWRELFTKDWKFLLGDPEGAEREEYCDRTWQHVDLPHDWVIHQPFYKGEDGPWTKQAMQGFFAWENTGWYRKEFILNETEDREVFVYFGCAYRNAAIYVNGRKAGFHAYGYGSFELPITPFIRPGKNLIAVRLEHGGHVPDRWYSGAGLFRDVYLRVAPPLHLKTWGLSVKAAVLDDGRAEVNVSAVFKNSSTAALHGAARFTITAPGGDSAGGGKVPGDENVPLEVAPGSEAGLDLTFTINSPALWSAEDPKLYRLAVSLDGRPAGETAFGIRRVEFAARRGLFINGKSVKLKGVCLHHDCGILGAAFYTAAWRRRLLILKGLGCNAVRTSHNPPAEELLDLCDELGFYVIDECFDKWKTLAYGELFGENWRNDLHDFMLRDRNHPSVIVWSLGNEVDAQGSEDMLKTEKMICEYARTLDDRPLTVALAPHVTELTPRDLVGAPPEKHVAITKKIAEFVDILGLNYHEPWYPYYTEHIGKPIIGTECYEYYSTSLYNYEDFEKKNPWFCVLENDNVLGQFIWAGVDYLWESRWPAKGWSAASLDICGFYRDESYLRKSLWSPEPVVHLCFYDNTQKRDYARGRWSYPATASHLNLDHLENRIVSAAIYTNCEEVELWINGKKLGRRKSGDYENGIVEWTFDYAKGKLKVVGYNGGKETCVQEMKTAGAPESIRLTADKTLLRADSNDLAHVEISVVDREGDLFPAEDLLLSFALEGDGQIMGASSPDMVNSLGFDLPRVYCSRGRALVIIKAGASTGELILNAYSDTLKSSSLRFTVGG
jgi:beta-galactosidase